VKEILGGLQDPMVTALGQSRDHEASETLSASAQFARVLSLCLQRQVAKLPSGLLYYCSLLRNNNTCYGKMYYFIWLVGHNTFSALATSEMPAWVHPWM